MHDDSRPTSGKKLENLTRFEIEQADRDRAQSGPRSYQAACHAQERERAIQDTLRRAIFLRDYDMVHDPLRDVARSLGYDLDEASDDFPALAGEATRDPMDVSEERVRRDRGVFGAPSRYFSNALAEIDTGTIPAASIGAVPLPHGQCKRVVPAAEAIRSARPMAPATTANAPIPAPPREKEPGEHQTMKNGETLALMTKRGLFPVPGPSSPGGVKPALATAPAPEALSEREPNLDDLFQLYIDARYAGKQGKRVKEKTNEKTAKSYQKNSLSKIQATRNITLALVGNKLARDLTEDDFIHLFSEVSKLPNTHGKSSADERPLGQVIRDTEREKESTVARARAAQIAIGGSEGNIEAANRATRRDTL